MMMMMKVAGKTLSISSSIVTVACIVLEIDKARYWSKIAIDSYVLKQSRIFPLQNTRSKSVANNLIGGNFYDRSK